MPSLVYSKKDNPSEEVYVIDKDVVNVGRLPSNDLVLYDSSVSRNHFFIKKEADGYYLCDNDSSNGTMLNNKWAGKKVRLNDMDVIKAGNVALTFKDEGLVTVKEVPPEELNSIASSPSLLNNVYLDIIFSVAREGIYTHDHEQFYNNTIKSICNALKADYGAILLIDETTGELLLKAVSDVQGKGVTGISSSILNKSVKNRAGILVKNAGIDNRFTGDHTIQNMGIYSALCAPIWEKDHIYGAIYADRKTGQPQFNEENLNFVTIIANLIALDIAHERLLQKIADERDIAEQVRRFVPMEAVSGLLDMIKNNPSSMWNVQEVSRTTVMFADIVGFTSLTEKTNPSEVAKLLRAFFERATDIVLSNGGSINKFLGDGFMAVFGMPLSHEDDSDRAIRSAVALIEWVKKDTAGIRIQLRIGIDTGPVMGIMIGSPRRLEYTVIGNCVNVASRLQSMAEADRILISSETNSFVQKPVDTKLIGEIAVKGKQNPVIVYQVVC
jgi:adenylate cyclase